MKVLSLTGNLSALAKAIKESRASEEENHNKIAQMDEEEKEENEDEIWFTDHKLSTIQAMRSVLYNR